MGYYYQKGIKYYNSSGNLVSDDYVRINLYNSYATYYPTNTDGVPTSSSGNSSNYYYGSTNIKYTHLSDRTPTLSKSAGKVRITTSQPVRWCANNSLSALSTAQSNGTLCSGSARDVIRTTTLSSLANGDTVRARYIVYNDDASPIYWSAEATMTTCANICSSAGTNCTTCSNSNANCTTCSNSSANCSACSNSSANCSACSNSSASCSSCTSSARSSSCVTKDTKIMLFNGEYKKVTDLDGTEVLAGYKDGKIVKSKLITIYQTNKTKYLYRVILSNKKEIIVSEYHPIMTNKGYRTVKPVSDFKYLMIGDGVLCSDLKYYPCDKILELSCNGMIYNLLTSTKNFIANDTIVASEDVSVFSRLPLPERVRNVSTYVLDGAYKANTNCCGSIKYSYATCGRNCGYTQTK